MSGTDIPLRRLANGDIITDILNCLSRNEVEKCQLLSQHWNFSILGRWRFLPTRILWALKILSNGNLTLYQDDSTELQLDVEEVKNSMRICNIDYLFMFIKNKEEAQKILEEIREVRTRPILVKHCRLIFEENFKNESTPVPSNFYSDLVHAAHIDFILDSRNLSYMFDNDYISWLPKPPITFDMDINFEAHCEPTPEILEKMIEFMCDSRMENYNRNKLEICLTRYYMSLPRRDWDSEMIDEFCERLVLMLELFENPSILFKETIIAHRSIYLLLHFREILKNRGYNHEEKIPDVFQEKLREDGWKIIVRTSAETGQQIIHFKIQKEI